VPRFSETEKEIIRERLFTQGERLFTALGIRKVSIDELAQAAGIAKGSFYSFYSSKEHLFIEIIFSLQKMMWSELEDFLRENHNLPPRELVKQTCFWMMEQIDRYPLIMKIDSETTDYLIRKLPKEIIEAHTRDDEAALLKLTEYGVNFICGIPMTAKIFQVLSLSFLNVMQEDKAARISIMNIILDGVLKEIVGETHD